MVNIDKTYYYNFLEILTSSMLIKHVLVNITEIWLILTKYIVTIL